MQSATYPLSDDPDRLQSEVLQLRHVVREKEQRIEQLLDYILQLHCSALVSTALAV